MKLSNNTIFITGGGSGIGRGLAIALHNLGNKVIIAGRRAKNLEETANAYPGIEWVTLDIEDAANIKTVAENLIKKYPSLNVLINNAGVMQIDDASNPIDDGLISSTITTNLLGPIRMVSALVDHLKKQTGATIINVSSVLGFIPLAMSAVYSSTKAAMHSYTLSLRYKLKTSGVNVLEIAPPWVQTDLLNSNDEPRAMPLKDFIRETIEVLGSDRSEVLVENAQLLRKSTGPEEFGFVTEFNNMMSAS